MNYLRSHPGHEAENVLVEYRNGLFSDLNVDKVAHYLYFIRRLPVFSGGAFSAAANLSDGTANSGGFWSIEPAGFANNFAGAVDPDEAGGAMYIGAGNVVAKFDVNLTTNVSDWTILD